MSKADRHIACCLGYKVHTNQGDCNTAHLEKTAEIVTSIFSNKLLYVFVVHSCNF